MQNYYIGLSQHKISSNVKYLRLWDTSLTNVSIFKPLLNTKLCSLAKYWFLCADWLLSSEISFLFQRHTDYAKV